MENTTNNNTNVANNNKRFKPICQTTLPATVKSLPTQRTINKGKNDETILFKTYVEVMTTYRPFNTDVYTKEKPDVDIGDVIELELQATDYKLKMRIN